MTDVDCCPVQHDTGTGVRALVGREPQGGGEGKSGVLALIYPLPTAPLDPSRYLLGPLFLLRNGDIESEGFWEV